MNRLEFLLSLQDKLSCLPQDDLEERLAFYNEMIDDRMEDGLSEEDAVAQIGNVDEIASQIIGEFPLSRLVKEKIKTKKQVKTWEIVLLAVGAPLWIPLLIAALAVAFSVYAVLWVVVICLWAVFASVAACVPAGLSAGVLFVCNGNVSSGMTLIAAAMVCAGLAIFLFYSCRAATTSVLLLTKKILLAIKHCFMKKEGV